MELDLDRCYRMLEARDARFDGAFYVGVRSTGIYCRPVCPARTPRKAQCDFFKHPAAAERAGFRPCLRCRPELAPGSAPVDAVARLARAAAARIEAGALNEGSLDDLATELSISTRQLRRAVEQEFGATPVELAQTRRLLLAKQLLSETALPVAVVADASGFASLRRFNHLFSARYGLSPTSLRRRGAESAKTDVLRLRLSYRPPLDWPALLGFLAGRGAAGVEAAHDNRYIRTVQIDRHRGWIAVGPRRGADALDIELSPSLLPVLVPLLARLRALFDLDAQPLAIAEVLGSDPRLAPLLATTPGLRVPGAFDGFELALRAILGQQVTVKAATTLFGRFARAYGEAIETPFAELTHLSPQAARIAAAPLQDLIDLGLTQARARSIHSVARAQVDGQLRLAPGLDAEAQLAVFRALPGIGDWTAAYVGMRALRLSDAFPYSDLALCKALAATPREALKQSEAWRPWRSYAALHLWRSLKAGG
jgi:AraC family transcriptional regulator of adaptative response / DNA-3-methyladenine glycosylase II